MDKQYEQYCLADQIFYDSPQQGDAQAMFPVSLRPLPDGWRRACSRMAVLMRNAKYASRSASGKAVTIYPADDAACERILHDLDIELSGSQGPYILSDLRYGSGPLYVRYGGFTERFCLDSRGETVAAIENPVGNLVPDLRSHVFRMPEWASLPEFLAPHLAARNAVTMTGLEYDLTGALHFRTAAEFTPPTTSGPASRSSPASRSRSRPATTSRSSARAVSASPVSPACSPGCSALVTRLGGYGATVIPATLSAGERQLIALTRAHLSTAPVVILDEATCHLDPAAEEQAEAAFARRGGTLIVIAHRISSARRARRVLVRDGVRPQAGDHASLLASSPGYADLAGQWDNHRHPERELVTPRRPADPSHL